MRRVIIFANGEYSSLDFYHNNIQCDDYIICADGGTNTAWEAGIIPDMVMGDFDSIENEVIEKLSFEKTQFIKFSSEKDESDLELSVLKATTLTPSEIIIFGALGKRLDHIIGNLMLLTIPLEAGIKGYILEEDYEIHLIDNENEIELDGGNSSIISLFPLSPVVKGVETRGLKYPLVKEDLYLGRSRGLSNEFAENKAWIKIKEGKLLIIKTNNQAPRLTE